MFVEKVRDIVGLYLNPPEKAIVLCVDEKSQTQALERTQPILPMRPGRPERQSHDYYRHGIVSLFSACDVATGRVIGKCHNRHREEEFLKFMNLVDRQLPGQTPIHLVLDNLATDKTPRVRNWFARRPRYVLHFTPTGSSWINQVERWFAKITTQAIRRGNFRSVKHLIEAIEAYIVEHNNEQQFRWSATANSIFEKITASPLKENSRSGGETDSPIKQWVQHGVGPMLWNNTLEFLRFLCWNPSSTRLAMHRVHLGVEPRKAGRRSARR